MKWRYGITELLGDYTVREIYGEKSWDSSPATFSGDSKHEVIEMLKCALEDCKKHKVKKI